MPDEPKLPGLSKSSPPRAPLTEIELLITLDRMRRSIERIELEMETAKKNDERFAKMETHFGIAKWFAAIAVVAAVGSLVTNIAARVSFRISDLPAPASNAERLGSDRVSKPSTLPP